LQAPPGKLIHINSVRGEVKKEAKKPAKKSAKKSAKKGRHSDGLG
jgi:hypothetical protein